MGQMTVHDRNQYERADLAAPDRTMRVTNQRPLVIFTILGLIVLGALGYAAIQGIDHWWQAMVLGVIVLTSIGLMIAVSPNRRA